jgi:exodeoxyribonuclease V alpha subunit
VNIQNFSLRETQVEAVTAELTLPSGEGIVTYMATHEAFVGIGEVKARRLWETFGNELFSILETNDAMRLKLVLSEGAAATILCAWSEHGDAQALAWLNKHSFGASVTKQLLAAFGRDVYRKLKEDPYRLLSFNGSWTAVDAFAQSEFGVRPDDPRRLRGAMEQACFQLFANGHTAVLPNKFVSTLRAILQSDEIDWPNLLAKVMALGQENCNYVLGPQRVHMLGAYLMEFVVAQTLASRINLGKCELLNRDEVDSLIARYQCAEHILLEREQREAVHLANEHALTVISGGAGSGKTTVLKTMYSLFDSCGIRVWQLALAGKAARRMQQVTGREASTIAGFLTKFRQENLQDLCCVVIDEASMVDVVTMYRLCLLLPVHARLLLCGDTNQLMPVGPGLILHCLADHPEVASIRLGKSNRFGGMIAAAATTILAGVVPTLEKDESAPIAFLRHTSFNVADEIVRHYKTNPLETQILCSRKGGPGGTKRINARLQEISDRPSLMVYDDLRQCSINSGFKLDDPVICTKNRWRDGLTNGSMGRIVEVCNGPQLLTVENDRGIVVLGFVMWDGGQRRPLTTGLLDDIELAYAITVHKSQGSQWKRVILVIESNRLMDRTLVYTGITRAESSVLLIGDHAAFKRAVLAPPKSADRQIGLPEILNSQLKALRQH